MKKIDSFPPNYEHIVVALGDVSKSRPVFCYGDTIFNPFGRDITLEVEQHESIHERQQELCGSPEAWWARYLTDPKFRFDQELEAYGEQYVFGREQGIGGKMLEWLLEKFASQLSDKAYGLLISFGEAESKIRNYGK